MARLKTIGSRVGTLPPKLKQTMAADSWRTSTMTSAQRGYGYKWQKARAGYLAKHPFCAYCLRPMGISYHQDAETIALQCTAAGHDLPFAHVVDHIVDHHGDDRLFWDSANNWQSLCNHHHSSTKQKESNRL